MDQTVLLIQIAAANHSVFSIETFSHTGLLLIFLFSLMKFASQSLYKVLRCWVHGTHVLIWQNKTSFNSTSLPIMLNFVHVIWHLLYN